MYFDELKDCFQMKQDMEQLERVIVMSAACFLWGCKNAKLIISGLLNSMIG